MNLKIIPILFFILLYSFQESHLSAQVPGQGQGVSDYESAIFSGMGNSAQAAPYETFPFPLTPPPPRQQSTQLIRPTIQNVTLEFLGGLAGALGFVILGVFVGGRINRILPSATPAGRTLLTTPMGISILSSVILGSGMGMYMAGNSIGGQFGHFGFTMLGSLIGALFGFSTIDNRTRFLSDKERYYWSLLTAIPAIFGGMAGYHSFGEESRFYVHRRSSPQEQFGNAMFPSSASTSQFLIPFFNWRF